MRLLLLVCRLINVIVTIRNVLIRLLNVVVAIGVDLAGDRSEGLCVSIIVDVVHSTVVIEHPTVDIAVPFPRLQRLYKSEEKKTKERIK